MRIAFVGKGGSGKTTLSALFAMHMNDRHHVLAVDADLNMHLGGLLGFENIERHISHPDVAENIKAYLKGSNERIKDVSRFRKTTPPTRDSRFIVLGDVDNPILDEFGVHGKGISLLTVGTYDAEEIGASCYHNNLSILENIMSHLIDKKGVLVVDMVAGVDAFANTLHAQFDLLVLVVEPTKRGVAVFEQYSALAKEAGVYDMLYVVANKVRSKKDLEFMEKHVLREKLLGMLGESEYLRVKEQEGGKIDINLLESDNRRVLEIIEQKLFSVKPDIQARLNKLFELHRTYVSQPFIRERFGDLTHQIDLDFDLQKFIDEYGGERKNV